MPMSYSVSLLQHSRGPRPRVVQTAQTARLLWDDWSDWKVGECDMTIELFIPYLSHHCYWEEIFPHLAWGIPQVSVLPPPPHLRSKWEDMITRFQCSSLSYLYTLDIASWTEEWTCICFLNSGFTSPRCVAATKNIMIDTGYCWNVEYISFKPHFIYKSTFLLFVNSTKTI